MQVMKWSVIALAVAAGTSQLAMASAQSESNGFVGDSSLNVLNRNFYMNRDWRNSGGNDADEDPTTPGESYGEVWSHGVIATYESGFTQGAVGFGLDAIGLVGLRLNSSHYAQGTSTLAFGNDGEPKDDFSRFGAAAKMRFSNTVLKFGDQFTALPVFSTDDSRLLPETARGALLTSNEIEGLELVAGHFTSLSAQNNVAHDANGLTEINLAGLTYAFTDQLGASLYYGDTEDNFKKWYGNVNFTQPLGEEQSMGVDFNIYRTKYDNAADDRNTIWSTAVNYAIGAHKFTVGYQKSSGDTGYAYGVDGGGTVWLNNSVQYSDFNGKDEKSWQVRYDLDLASFGVPGLSFMTRYLKGTDIDTGAASSSDESEINVEAKYVIQDGAAKDLSFRVRQAYYRTDTAYGNDVNDTRVIIEYPLSIL